MVLYLRLRTLADFKKCVNFFSPTNTDSNFVSDAGQCSEFLSIGFNVENQEDADATENELREELVDFSVVDSFYFEVEREAEIKLQVKPTHTEAMHLQMVGRTLRQSKMVVVKFKHGEQDFISSGILYYAGVRNGKAYGVASPILAKKFNSLESEAINDAKSIIANCGYTEIETETYNGL